MKKIIQKIKDGDHVTDGELLAALKWYKTTADLLVPFGELYYLVWKDINSELNRLEEYRKARKIV